jgi:hypothetical protein
MISALRVMAQDLIMCYGWAITQALVMRYAHCAKIITRAQTYTIVFLKLARFFLKEIVLNPWFLKKKIWIPAVAHSAERI